MRLPLVTRLVPALVVAALGVSACNGGAGPASPDEPPVTVAAGQGTDPATITLNAQAVRRIGIQTKPVVARSASLTIPYSAVVYDASGSAWAFATITPRTYVRSPIVIASIAGDTATLKSGPPPGTQVVTVGAPELVGAEAGIAGEE
jgi:hypothetical protein